MACPARLNVARGARGSRLQSETTGDKSQGATRTMSQGERERLAGAWPKNHDTTGENGGGYTGFYDDTARAHTVGIYHTRERGCSGYAFFKRRRLIFARRHIFVAVYAASRTQRPSTQSSDCVQQ